MSFKRHFRKIVHIVTLVFSSLNVRLKTPYFTTFYAIFAIKRAVFLYCKVSLQIRKNCSSVVIRLLQTIIIPYEIFLHTLAKIGGGPRGSFSKGYKITFFQPKT